MIPVSVAVITRNEEHNIGDALESVRDFEDIVVVDSFSEDKTVEICRKYTPRVYQHAWEGFARQKQKAIDLTAKEWVLLLDADERVTTELRSEIARKISAVHTAGFYLPRKNFFLGKWIRHSGWWPDHTLRLFRKEVSSMQYREVHERVLVSGPLEYMKNPLEHHTYRTLSEYVSKMEYYSSLSAKDSSVRGARLLWSMVIHPPFTFLRMFLIRQGFRDGIHGFLLAVLYSFYTFLKYAKTWEKNRTS
jgi:glycosyltransferase involved in cell wall biosynthesis